MLDLLEDVPAIQRGRRGRGRGLRQRARRALRQAGFTLGGRLPGRLRVLGEGGGHLGSAVAARQPELPLGTAARRRPEDPVGGVPLDPALV